MANKEKFRRGIHQSISFEHLRGNLDSEALLQDLGIDFSFRLSPTQIMCHCPDLQGNHMNGDANPSFGFNEEKLAYNCFVCGGGNVIELVQLMQPDCTDEDALIYLERFTLGNVQSADDLLAKVQRLMHPEEEAPMPDYPDDALFRYRKIHPYLYERGLSKDVIVKMQVGFDESHAGITIPHWFQGRLRGWQTRHLATNAAGEFVCEHESCNVKGKMPKYKNTTNFPKVNTLYAYDQFKEALRESGGDTAIVVESPMTALKLMSMGFDNVLATFGQFSVEQGMLLLPMRLVYFWPDNDKAGYENAERCLHSLGRYTSVKIVPVVDTPKGDAANLDTRAEVDCYLETAYSASLFPLLAKDGLPTLKQVQHAYSTSTKDNGSPVSA